MSPALVFTALSSTPSGGDLSSVKTVTTFMWTEIGTVVSTIVSTPLLLLPIGFMVAGAAIGLAKRFIGR